MLKPAKLYQTKINELEISLWGSSRTMFWNCNCYHNVHDFSNDTWLELYFVSVDPETDEVIGIIGGDIYRSANYIKSLSICNFINDKHTIFAKDLMIFIKELFLKYNFNKICFSVIIGNPVEEHYDKLTEKLGGRIVGIFKNHAVLHNNKIYDQKYYEIMKDDFIKTKYANMNSEEFIEFS